MKAIIAITLLALITCQNNLSCFKDAVKEVNKRCKHTTCTEEQRLKFLFELNEKCENPSNPVFENTKFECFKSALNQAIESCINKNCNQTEYAKEFVSNYKKCKPQNVSQYPVPDPNDPEEICKMNTFERNAECKQYFIIDNGMSTLIMGWFREHCDHAAQSWSKNVYECMIGNFKNVRINCKGCNEEQFDAYMMKAFNC